MLFQTNNCHLYKHPEFCFNCDTKIISEQEIKFIVNWLESEVAQGKVFQSEEIVQFGCFFNKLHIMKDGFLHILEPDMKMFPINFIDSLTNTLRYYTRQKYVNESILTVKHLYFPTIRESIAVNTSYHNSKNIYMCRDTPKNTFSGWMVSDLSNDKSETNLISIYEFALKRPDLLEFMALPVKFAVKIKKGNSIKFFHKDSEVKIQTNSYIDNINRYLKGLSIS